MLQVSTCAELETVLQPWKTQEFKTALVPTMGALHEGHLSLIRLAQEKADKVLVSIFVNPTQFAPDEDFDAYPRDFQSDIALLEQEDVDLVYTPDETQIYPDGKDTNIRVGQAGQGLESDFRPHFFAGVVNVVARFFAQIQPDIALFGEKDFQQLQVITEMVETLGLPIDIIGAPIIRDEQGLALSSRNAYLSEEELTTARQLNKIIGQAADEKLSRQDAKSQIIAAGFDKIDYLEQRWNRILVAAWLGKTRLIDNIALNSRHNI